MIDVSSRTVNTLPIFSRAGTYGETPPRPRSPWHWPQANYTSQWVPAATCGSIWAAAVALVVAGPREPWPAAQAPAATTAETATMPTRTGVRRIGSERYTVGYRR